MVIAAVGVCACECVRGACAVMCCTMYGCVARRMDTCFIEGIRRLIHVDGDTENSLSQQHLGVQLPYHDNVKL